MRRHSVLNPDPASPHQPATNDAALLLADLVRSRRMGERAWLTEPFTAPSVCTACAEAYRAAWFLVREAGGIEEWLHRFERRERAGRS